MNIKKEVKFIVEFDVNEIAKIEHQLGETIYRANLCESYKDEFSKEDLLKFFDLLNASKI